MAEYTLPHFGALDIENLEEFYLTDIESNGNTVHVDLNFETQSLDTDTMDKVKTFIDSIERINILNNKHITNDFNDEDGDTVRVYMDHHIEELDSAEISNLINFDDTKIEPTKQLLSKLRLVRVGIYPQNEDFFASFDYSIGMDLTDYLIVIYTDEHGQLQDMVMES